MRGFNDDSVRSFTLCFALFFAVRIFCPKISCPMSLSRGRQQLFSHSFFLSFFVTPTPFH